VIDAIRAGHVAACQDISDGGLLTALAEMALGGFGEGRLGAKIALTAAQMLLPPDPARPDAPEQFLRPDKWLFSESSGFVLEANPGHEAALQEIFAGYGLSLMKIGEVSADPIFEVTLDGERLLRLSLDAMRDAWGNGLARVLR